MTTARRGLVAALMLALLTLVTGCAGLTVAGTGTSELAGLAGLARSEPAEISIPRIGATSSLMELGLNDDETVQVPPIDQPLQAGWYRHGVTPGEAGSAVILGHVDGGGQPGIFHRLLDVQAGDEVLVRRADGRTAVFTVSRTQQVPKAEFPTEAVYGPSDRPELRVVTCGGDFDQARRSYRDNVIVYATLTAVR